jgi:hypothetical protein
MLTTQAPTCFFLGSPSSKPTMLRLISNYYESDGRYVHILEPINHINLIINITFKSKIKILIINFSFNKLIVIHYYLKKLHLDLNYILMQNLKN